MSNPIHLDTSFGKNVQSLANAQDKKENDVTAGQAIALENDKNAEKISEPISIRHKKQLNAAIIESSLKASNSIADKPLSLLLKTALQGINEALRETDSENAVEQAYESGIDVSPEATAERIVAFSTQYFNAYQEQYPQMNQQESLAAFVNMINAGIEQGFSEAKHILEGLNVLTGDIVINIDKTNALVQEGIQAFVDSFSVNRDL